MVIDDSPEPDPVPLAAEQFSPHQRLYMLLNGNEEPDPAVLLNMLQEGGHPNTIVPPGTSALHAAAEHGHVRSIELMCNQNIPGFDINTLAPHSDWTALMGAAMYNQPAAIKALLANGADTSCTGSQTGDTALHIAAFNHAAPAIAALLSSPEVVQMVNHRNEDGETPLHSLATRCQIWPPQAGKNAGEESLDLLVAAGADATLTDDSGMTPLMVCAPGSNPDLLRKLIPISGDVNRTCNDGQTALHYAAMKCQRENIRQLLEAGCDATLRSKYGMSPIFLATLAFVNPYGSNDNTDTDPKDIADTIHLLAASGGDVNMPDLDGELPLSYALHNSSPVEVKQALLDCGAHIPADGEHFLATASRLHYAHERFDALIACTPPAIENVCAKDLVWFANAHLLDAALAPHLWRGHEAHLAKLLSQLPPALAHEAVARCNRLLPTSTVSAEGIAHRPPARTGLEPSGV